MSSGSIGRISVALVVNGAHQSAEVEPRLLLADFLRDHLDLAGVHVGCEHGVCGACTVLMNGESIRSCLTFAVQADGQQITTIEGLADGGKLHPIQQAFADAQGLQCGFCTPGMVLRAKEILDATPDPTAEQIREDLSGNLCRCTGYQFIVQAVLDAATRVRDGEAAAASTGSAPHDRAARGGRVARQTR